MSNFKQSDAPREKKPKIYLTQLTMKENAYGTYFVGKLGMTWLMLSPSKNDPNKWNLSQEQADLDQDRNAQAQKGEPPF